MNDDECLKIEISACAHLLRCALEDFAMASYETSNALQHLRKELQE